MANKINIEEEEPLDKGQQSFTEGLHRILMAGLGSISLAQSEVESFVKRLVDRGELGEKDARSLLNEFLEKRKQKAEETGKWVEAELERRMEQLLVHMNVPTKADIAELSKKVEALSEKLEQLNKRK